MNPAISQLIDIHLAWMTARRKELIHVANNLDLDHNEIYQTLSDDEKDLYYSEIDKLYKPLERG